MAHVAGCVVTSSTRPSPSTQTLRPSRRNVSRYSAPVRIILLRSRARLPEMAELRRDDVRVRDIAVEHPCAPGKGVYRHHRFLAEHRVVKGQIAPDNACDQRGLAWRKPLLADHRGARNIRPQLLVCGDEG